MRDSIDLTNNNLSKKKGNNQEGRLTGYHAVSNYFFPEVQLFTLFLCFFTDTAAAKPTFSVLLAVSVFQHFDKSTAAAAHRAVLSPLMYGGQALLPLS